MVSSVQRFCFIWRVHPEWFISYTHSPARVQRKHQTCSLHFQSVLTEREGCRTESCCPCWGAVGRDIAPTSQNSQAETCPVPMDKVKIVCVFLRNWTARDDVMKILGYLLRAGHQSRLDARTRETSQLSSTYLLIAGCQGLFKYLYEFSKSKEPELRNFLVKELISGILI